MKSFHGVIRNSFHFAHHFRRVNRHAACKFLSSCWAPFCGKPLEFFSLDDDFIKLITLRRNSEMISMYTKDATAYATICLEHHESSTEIPSKETLFSTFPLTFLITRNKRMVFSKWFSYRYIIDLL